ncbi:MAG: amidohydrolase family protein [Solirubrobacteraceae bacterium]
MDRLIDAHIHFWEPDARRHEWLSAVPKLQRRFVPSDVEFGSPAPDGLVFVEADCQPDEALSEVDWVSSVAAGDVPIVGIVAHAPLEQGSGVEVLLDQLARRPLVVGVRRLLQHEPPALLADPALVEGTRLLAGRGLTSDLCVTMEQLPAVTKLVRACPHTSFVLDHLGKPAVGERFPGTWAEDIRELASCPNVSCKLSGLATIAAPGRRDDLLPYLRHVIDAFGPWRCLFGSDWPVSLEGTSYEGWLDVVAEAADCLDQAERAAVLGENAIRIYDLRDPSDTRSAHAGS